MTDIASLRLPELIADVKRSCFDRIDEQLNDLQNAFERGERSEKLLMAAMKPFFNFDQQLVEPLERWVKAKPTSYAASLARGTHLISEGHERRTGKRAKHVTEEQWAGMYNRFHVAHDELSRSLELTAKPVLSHVELMRLENVGGSLEQAQHHYQIALELHPTSLAARRQMIWLLRPEWKGGQTFEALERFLADPSHQSLDSDGQRLLTADRASAEAHWVNLFEERPADSLSAYERAMTLDPENEFNAYGRGSALLRLGRYSEALPDFEQALRVRHSHNTGMFLALCLLRVNLRDARARALLEAGAKDGDEMCIEFLDHLNHPGWFNSRLKRYMKL